jgi:uncharacterized membrane protein
MSDPTAILVVVTALGCGLAAGIFFVFSTFVMKALGDVPPAHGIGVMQAINVRVINPWFMTVFLGTGVTSAATVVVALANLGESFAPYLLAGGALYLVGVIWVTMAQNQPRNLALAKLDPAEAESAAFWTRYLREWNAWNHVRTAAPLIAAALEIVALRVG